MMQHELTFLSDAAETLRLADDPRTFLETVFKKLSAIVRLDVYLLYIMSEDGTHLLLCASEGLSDAQRANTAQLALGQAICGVVAERRTPMIISDVQARSDETMAVIRQLGLRAYVCYPLMARGQLLGTLSFGSREHHRIA